MKSILSMIGCGCFVVTLAGNAWAQGLPPIGPIDPVHTPWYVTVNGNDAAQGDSWATAFATVQRALDMVEPDGQIWVAQGHYSSSYVRRITKPLRIYGGFIGNESSIAQRPPPGTTAPTVIRGDTSNLPAHVFYIEEINTSQVVIDRVEIAHGHASDQGGGIWAKCVNLVLSDVTVRNCHADQYGGGISFGDSVFGGCSTPWRRLSMKNCTIKDNGALLPDTLLGYGGGLAVSGPAFGEIVNTTFQGNYAEISGGGCHVMGQDQSHVLDFVGCVFVDNTCAGSSLGSAGGLSVSVFHPGSYANVRLTNCTFSANTVLNFGDGGAFSVDAGSQCTVRNTIVWGNSFSVWYEVLGPLAGVYNSAGRSGWINPWPGNNNIVDTDPLFILPTNPDLQIGSPCIDKGRPLYLPNDVLDVDGDGNTSEALPLDILNRPRSVDNPNVTPGVLDMGAYERPYP